MERQDHSAQCHPPPPPPSGLENSTGGAQTPLVKTSIEIPLRHPFSQSCWKRRTLLEKSLLFFIAILALIVILLIIVAAWPTKNKEDVCLKEECVRISGRILDAMDSSVDPCEDFFEYACGTWNRVNAIPDDKPFYNTFRKLGDELHNQLRALIEEPITEKQLEAKIKVKNLYRSCMNTKAIETRQEEPLMRLLSEVGGWPVLHRNWTDSGFALEEQMGRLRLLNVRAIINQRVGTDDKNSSVHIITLDQPPLGMPSREYFLRGDAAAALSAYRTLAVNVAKALGAEDDNETEREMKEMIDFEVKLANITMPEENRRDTEAIYNKMNVSRLYQIAKNFDWLRYFRSVFKSVNIEINDSEVVVVYSVKYLSELGNLLQATPNKTLANYLVWHVVVNGINQLSQKFLDLRRNLNKALHGTDQETARWRTCVQYANDLLGMALGRMFIERHFQKDSRANAMSMIESIRAAFVELLDEVQWMDSETRKVAREKAAAMLERIGYPDYILNDTALNIDIEELRPDPTKFFENTVTYFRISTRKNLMNLRLPVDKSKWLANPAIINAYYSATKNQIIFPAGILQPPFYHAQYPKSVNFGGIAVVIGHELTHGFDDKGRQYDKDGNLKQWWSDSVINRFKDKARCIIEQYNNYTVKEVGLNLNGKQTQGENIADNGGLKQAFRAYNRWVENTNAKEGRLPGLSLSQKQLFFLNFAQIWCGTARPEYYMQTIRMGRHSPGRFRVIGALSNSEDFAEAYQCKVGSKMNPKNKCSIW